jgi:hypothetical protein
VKIVAQNKAVLQKFAGERVSFLDEPEELAPGEAFRFYTGRNIDE